MSVRQPKSFQIGFSIGSQRKVRVAPQVTDTVLDTTKAHMGRRGEGCSITFDQIDLAEQPLAIANEPVIPLHVKSANAYRSELP